ncbi:DUF5682 family protein [Rhodococcus sp. (in: high G+C Gram-positive bacteria)]|uniref:DUF5682 family protein n=1 Tax=Rhodococcus sp. TaxID=1831 RepID=UPI001A0EA74E|nr:DUF5682 family protein [Rhodococcus sp. (in: high G+C Gram-positive bacteria)]MBF0661540.1 hypothetical protein [Rhodococcus sp. (in: high G+C Gram-positive bacteria)]
MPGDHRVSDGAEIRVFGIRHHGPGSARAVLRALAEFEPDTVLIEGPADADPFLALAASDEMQPPVALLAYVRDEPARAAFWPFAAFSPEWQALRWAILHDADVRFCDLPAAISLAADRSPESAERTDPLAALASAAGYDDFEQWWDAVIEHASAEEESGAGAFDEITAAMAALRADVELDEHTARREAHMRQVLRTAVKAGARNIAVVCGAMHAPALSGPLGPAAPDARVLRGLPKVKAALTWVPWTHSRLSAASGYGAGITSPGWYDHLFRYPDDTTARWFTRVARVLREEDLPVSSAHVIEATRLADTLAALRGRAVPGLAEAVEATRAVLCDGDEVLLDFVARTLVIGEALGAVPEDTPTVPLDADLQARSKSLRLKRAPIAKKLDLDLRKDLDLQRSRLLHKLSLLGIEWALPAESAVRSTGTFRETWSLQWDPELAVAIVEASRWGTTVEAAASATVLDRARTAGTTLGEVTDLLEQALLADLRDAVPQLVTAIDAAAALDHDVLHLMSALPSLIRTVRYGDVRGTDLSSLVHVADAVLARVCAGLPSAVTGLDTDAADTVRNAVDEVHTALALRDDPGATERWLDTLASVCDRDDVDGVLTGRTVRMLRDVGRLDERATAVRVARALSVGSAAAAKARWIDGFVGGGGLLLVHDRDLLSLIDTWVSDLRSEEFVDVLPVLRRTFGSFAHGERSLLGRAVRGGPEHRTSAALDAERGRRAVAATALILGVPA